MSVSDKQAEFVEHWMASDEFEAPVLLTGASAARLLEFAVSLGQRQGTEVLTLLCDSPTIAIEEVRRLSLSLTMTSLSDRRLVVISEAERLSLPAAAALLKQLEESSITTRYLLTTVYPRRLLQTIVSRCQRVRLQVPATSGDPKATPEESSKIEQVAAQLAGKLRRDGPSGGLRLAFWRLRDYYQIKSLRGNEKLAREVLLASLPSNDT